MNTSDIRDIERILDLYKTNNLNYAGKKIVDTNELLILLLSKINNFTKKKQIESLQDLVLNFLLKESSTCSKDRIPNYIDNEISCGEDYEIKKNKEGDDCCFLIRGKHKKTQKSNSKQIKKKKDISSIRRRASSSMSTNIFSKNHKLKYLDIAINSISNVNTYGYMGRSINIILLENIDNEIEEDNIKNWNNSKKYIKLEDTITTENSDYLVIKYNNNLALLKGISSENKILPFECIEIIESKTQKYKRIFHLNEEMAIIKAIHFFLEGDIYNQFYIPITKNYVEKIMHNQQIEIEIEKDLKVNEMSDTDSFITLFVIDAKESIEKNKINIKLINNNKINQFTPIELKILINKQNINDIRGKYNIL